MERSDAVATCPLDPQCRRFDCQRAKTLAAVLLEQHRGTNIGVDLAQGDFDAGEWEVAVISVIESVDVSPSVVDELEMMADRCFDDVDGPIARRIVAKKRSKRDATAELAKPG